MEFTKDMLRTGMRVVHRNGEVGIVFKDVSTIGYKDGFDCLKGYDENLYILERDWDGCADWDIMKVYDGYSQHTNLINFNKLGELIWERKEETEQQKQIRELQETIKKAEEQIEKLKKGI